MIFLTEHVRYKLLDTPRIIADSWEEAESLCSYDYKVIGVLIEEIDVDDNKLNFNFSLN